MDLASVTLPDGLNWIDEFDDQSISQVARRRLDGGLTLYVRSNLAGRPITLEATAEQWITRAQAQSLALLAAVPGGRYTLTFTARAGLAFQVAWRHHEAPALDLRPLVDYADPAADDPLIGTLKLMTI
jgi:hypothetical protein